MDLWLPQGRCVMAAQTTTGIALRNYWRTGDYVVTQPGKAEVRLSADEAGAKPYDAAAVAADLGPGYWLRNGQGFVDAEGRKYTEWTWVAL